MALFLLGWVDGTQEQKQPGADEHRLRNTLERQNLTLTGNIWLRIGMHCTRSGEATVDGSAELTA